MSSSWSASRNHTLHRDDFEAKVPHFFWGSLLEGLYLSDGEPLQGQVAVYHSEEIKFCYLSLSHMG